MSIQIQNLKLSNQWLKDLLNKTEDELKLGMREVQNEKARS